MTHLLYLRVLHTAAPGVLDVIFGPDGGFVGAPNWHPPLWDGAWAYHIGDVPDPLDGLALDLRIPSVAARLAGLCARVPFTDDDDGVTRITRLSVLDEVTRDVARGHMRVGSASALAALTLKLAPAIAALRSTP